MRNSNYRMVVNFIEFYGKPFTCAIVAGETGLTQSQAMKILGRMLTAGLIKAISREGKYAIYIKNLDYKASTLVNRYNFEIKFLKQIINKVKKEDITSARQLTESLGCGRKRLSRYLSALCSIGIIDYVDNRLKVVKKIDLLLVGSKYDSQILRKLKTKHK